MIITIDGPAGSGKSTVARLLATRLNAPYLDTGAMYRIVGLFCLKQGLTPGDESLAQQIADLAASIGMEFRGGVVLAEGADWSDQIRTAEVTQAASRIANNRQVRAVLVRKQREFAETLGKLVTEGRDQGSVVFPDAPCKFYLTANVDERARRRYEELARQGVDVSLAEVREQIIERDTRDETRTEDPLRQPEDAIIIDTSGHSIEQIVTDLLGHVEQVRTAAEAES